MSYLFICSHIIVKNKSRSIVCSMVQCILILEYFILNGAINPIISQFAFCDEPCRKLLLRYLTFFSEMFLKNTLKYSFQLKFEIDVCFSGAFNPFIMQIYSKASEVWSMFLLKTINRKRESAHINISSAFFHNVFYMISITLPFW